MFNLLKRLSGSLGISQNADRFQSQLQNELNVQLHVLKRVAAVSAKAMILGLAAVITGVFTSVLAVMLVYQLLVPHTGSAGALAIVGGTFALCSLLLTLKVIELLRNSPKLQRITFPKIYVPVENVEQAPLNGSSLNGSSRNEYDSKLSADSSTALSGFMLDELQRRFYDSSLDSSVKNFASSFGGDSRRIAEDVLHSAEENLATAGTSKKYAILAMAVAAGYLASRKSS
jgi:hypothetical protein